MDATPETIIGLELPDVVRLLDPCYRDRSQLRLLVRRELVSYDEDKECWHRTPGGDDLAAAIRTTHAMRFVQDPGGGRWHVPCRGSDRIRELHAGDGCEVLLGDGSWHPLRFEVVFREHENACNGRLPRFYLAVAGSSSAVVIPSGERWQDLLVRYIPRA